MATPTLWLGEFQANLGDANIPATSDPQIVGLSNGNFLVAWTESGTTGVATQTGLDIVGKIFDGEGNIVRDSYRLNVNRTADEESDFDIAATNDGGFMLVFVDNDGADSRVVWERKNAAGNQINTVDIVSETGTGDFDNPQIVVNNINNTSHVIWTDLDTAGFPPADDDIRGVQLNSTGGIIVTERAFGGNSGDDEREGSVAINTNGEIVTVYRNTDTDEVILNVRTTTGTLLHTAVVDDTGNPSDPHVATLSNGNIAVVWTDDVGGGSSGDVNRAVYNSNLGVVQNKISINNTDANEAQIVALPDGGFVVVWDDDSAATNDIKARKYTNTGASDGNVFTVDTSAGTSPSVGVTGDGRVLFTWNQSSNTKVSIWDPRDGTINASTYDNPQEQFVDGDTIFGAVAGGFINGDNGTADTIIGRDGNDIITGGDDADTIEGRGGNDSINGGSGTDTIDGGSGNDTIFISDGDNIDNVDGGTGTDTLNLIDLVGAGDAVNINMNTNNWSGRGGVRSIDSIETVIGTQENDTIRGDGAKQTLNGFDGNDLISGGFGNDFLNGQNGIDTVDYSYDPVPPPLTITGSRTINLATGESFLSSILIGGAPSDVDTLSNFENVIGSGHRDFITGTSGTNVISGGGGADTINTGAGADTANGDAGNDTFIDDQTAGSAINNDVYNGGSGTDTVVYTVNHNSSVSVNLTTNQQVFNGNVRDTYTSIENITVAGSESVTGNSGNNVLTGTGATGNNVFNGEAGDDTINAGGGSDVINAGIGADTVDAGAGNDTINDTDAISQIDDYDGGDGTDTLVHDRSWTTGVLFDLLNGQQSFAGTDYDTYSNIENITVGGGAFVIGNNNDNVITVNDTGFSENNELSGMGGNDTINAGVGDDILDGGTGGDTLNGGDGFDTASYASALFKVRVFLDNPGANTGDASGDVFNSIEKYEGSAFNDRFEGSGDDDIIFGADGDDVLVGRGGRDELHGEDGDDRMVGGNNGDIMVGGDGADEHFGGAGTNFASYIDSAVGVRADLVNTATNTGFAVGDTYTDIGGFIGSDFDDRLLGNDLVNVHQGGTGADTLSGQGRRDILEGEEGNDRLFGNRGKDELNGGLGADEFDGGAGEDTVVYEDATTGVLADLLNAAANTNEAAGDTYSSIENIRGSAFGDNLRGDNANNKIDGGDGADQLFGRDGRDTLRGDAGVDVISAGDGADFLDGGTGNDILTGGADNDRFAFRDALSTDEITDFTSGTDKIQLDDAGFTSLVGSVAASNLRFGTSAADANDFLIYDSATGRLWYDADGSGGGAQVQIAELSNLALIDSNDFQII